MAVVGGFDSLRKSHSLENVTSDHRDLQCVLEIVVKSIAPGEAFDGAARQGAQTLSHVVLCVTKNTTEILGEKLAKLVGCQCRDCLHRPSPSWQDVIILGGNWKTKDAGQYAPPNLNAIHSFWLVAALFELTRRPN